MAGAQRPRPLFCNNHAAWRILGKVAPQPTHSRSRRGVFASGICVGNPGKSPTKSQVSAPSSAMNCAASVAKDPLLEPEKNLGDFTDGGFAPSLGVGVVDVADGPGEVELASAFFAAGEVNSASVSRSHIVCTPDRSGVVLNSMPKSLPAVQLPGFVFRSEAGMGSFNAQGRSASFLFFLQKDTYRTSGFWCILRLWVGWKKRCVKNPKLHDE